MAVKLVYDLVHELNVYLLSNYCVRSIMPGMGLVTK